MFAWPIWIKNPAPAEAETSGCCFGFHLQAQLVLAAGICGCGINRSPVLRQRLVRNLVFDTRAKAENVVCAEVVYPRKKLQAVIFEPYVLRRFEVNPGRCYPRCMETNIGRELLDRSPGCFGQCAAKP